eukprot:tig00020537_g10267.t1
MSAPAGPGPPARALKRPPAAGVPSGPNEALLLQAVVTSVLTGHFDERAALAVERLPPEQAAAFLDKLFSSKFFSQLSSGKASNAELVAFFEHCTRFVVAFGHDRMQQWKSLALRLLDTTEVALGDKVAAFVKEVALRDAAFIDALVEHAAAAQRREAGGRPFPAAPPCPSRPWWPSGRRRRAPSSSTSPASCRTAAPPPPRRHRHPPRRPRPPRGGAPRARSSPPPSGPSPPSSPTRRRRRGRPSCADLCAVFCHIATGRVPIAERLEPPSPNSPAAVSHPRPRVPSFGAFSFSGNLAVTHYLRSPGPRHGSPAPDAAATPSSPRTAHHASSLPAPSSIPPIKPGLLSLELPPARPAAGPPARAWEGAPPAGLQRPLALLFARLYALFPIRLLAALREFPEGPSPAPSPSGAPRPAPEAPTLAAIVAPLLEALPVNERLVSGSAEREESADEWRAMDPARLAALCRRFEQPLLHPSPAASPRLPGGLSPFSQSPAALASPGPLRSPPPASTAGPGPEGAAAAPRGAPDVVYVAELLEAAPETPEAPPDPRAPSYSAEDPVPVPVPGPASSTPAEPPALEPPPGPARPNAPPALKVRALRGGAGRGEGGPPPAPPPRTAPLGDAPPRPAPAPAPPPSEPPGEGPAAEGEAACGRCGAGLAAEGDAEAGPGSLLERAARLAASISALQGELHGLLLASGRRGGGGPEEAPAHPSFLAERLTKLELASELLFERFTRLQLQRELQAAAAAAAELRAQAAHREGLVAALKEAVARMRRELAEAAARHRSRYDSLHGALTRRTEERARLAQHTVELQELRAEAEAELARAREEHARTAAALAALEDRHAALAARLPALLAPAPGPPECAGRHREAALEHLQGLLKQTSAALAAERERAREAERRAAWLEARLEEKTQALATLKNLSEEAKRSAAARLAAASERCEELRESGLALQVRVAELEQELLQHAPASALLPKATPAAG